MQSPLLENSDEKIKSIFEFEQIFCEYTCTVEFKVNHFLCVYFFKDYLNIFKTDNPMLSSLILFAIVFFSYSNCTGKNQG